MRQIKFRAWSLLLSEMYYPKPKTFLSSGVYVGKNSTEYLNTILYDPDFVPMQFTGLKDKNGVEVYEGDILCWPRYENTNYQTRWVVEWDSFRAGWSDWSPRGEAEVIGNIFENPELLK